MKRHVLVAAIVAVGMIFVAPVASAQTPPIIPPPMGAAAAMATPSSTPGSTQPAPGAQPSAAEAQRAMGDRSYALGMGDVVDISVVGRSDFTTRARIGSDGAVMLPLLGTVTAVEKTPGQLADDIRAALESGGFFSSPVVRVEVVGFASRYVTVLGNVGSPGLLPLDRTYRLSEIMARVGGRSNGGGEYVVLTRMDGTSKRFKIADLGTAVGESDPPVAAGDKIFIPAGENEVFYLTGAVKNPGMYQIADSMTLRLAIARGGGVSDMGSEGKVKINRKGKDLKGVKLDETVIEPGDIIKVGERLF